MARWLSFFAEYNFSVEYKPGRLNVVADALSRRPNFEPAAQPDTGPTTVAVLTSSVPSSILLEDTCKAYDPGMVRLMDHLSQPSRQSLKRLPPVYRFSTDGYTVHNGLLKYTAVAGDTLVSSYRTMVTCDCASCMCTTMHLLVDIVVERRHISQLVATFTGSASISLFAIKFVLVKCANG